MFFWLACLKNRLLSAKKRGGYLADEPIVFTTILLVACLAAPLFAAETYVFGVHPCKNLAELAIIFKPMISLLEAETGAKISFRSAKDYESFNQAILKGEIDIFFVGPSPYAELSGLHPDKVRLVATALNKGKPSDYVSLFGIIKKVDAKISK